MSKELNQRYTQKGRYKFCSYMPIFCAILKFAYFFLQPIIGLEGRIGENISDRASYRKNRSRRTRN